MIVSWWGRQQHEPRNGGVGLTVMDTLPHANGSRKKNKDGFGEKWNKTKLWAAWIKLIFHPEAVGSDSRHNSIGKWYEAKVNFRALPPHQSSPLSPLRLFA